MPPKPLLVLSDFIDRFHASRQQHPVHSGHSHAEGMTSRGGCLAGKIPALSKGLTPLPTNES